MPRISYVNGRYVPHQHAQVHIEDRGFQFADGAYEVVALINGRFADAAGHLDRFERSLRELQIKMPMPRQSLVFVMQEMARRNRLHNGSLYIQASRGAAPRDFKFPAHADTTLVMTLRPATFGTLVPRKAVCVPDIRWKRRDIKSTALLPQVLAKQAAVEQGAYEALMLDDDGVITEGSSTNAWMVDAKGTLITRSTRNNMILKGVTRNALQALGDFKIIERGFTPAEAYKAKEIFTTAAVSLVTPIVELDGNRIGDGKVGPVAKKVLDVYLAYAARTPDNKQKRWSYP